jgi:hypothetical protein
VDAVQIEYEVVRRVSAAAAAERWLGDVNSTRPRTASGRRAHLRLLVGGVTLPVGHAAGRKHTLLNLFQWLLPKIEASVATLDQTLLD